MSTRTEIILEIDRWIVVSRPATKRRCSEYARSEESESLTNPDGLDVYELADAKLREFTSVTGMFDSAEGQARI